MLLFVLFYVASLHATLCWAVLQHCFVCNCYCSYSAGFHKGWEEGGLHPTATCGGHVCCCAGFWGDGLEARKSGQTGYSTTILTKSEKCPPLPTPSNKCIKKKHTHKKKLFYIRAILEDISYFQLSRGGRLQLLYVCEWNSSTPKRDLRNLLKNAQNTS